MVINLEYTRMRPKGRRTPRFNLSRCAFLGHLMYRRVGQSAWHHQHYLSVRKVPAPAAKEFRFHLNVQSDYPRRQMRSTLLWKNCRYTLHQCIIKMSDFSLAA